MALTRAMDKKTRKKVAFQANFIALALLLLFGFFGFYLFEWMGISASALQISGGLLLLLVALQLLTGKEQDPGDAGGSIHVAMVPLGMPLLAGPGAIVAFMLLMRDTDGDLVDTLTVIGAMVLVIMIVGGHAFFRCDYARARRGGRHAPHAAGRHAPRCDCGSIDDRWRSWRDRTFNELTDTVNTQAGREISRPACYLSQ